ncbi:hypothetical protein AB6809_30960 [Paraburkholderia sp. RCC_158]|uniref:hypothetical protein n=1 Tax=Paraburkholderia sp. RCC_158 TaxID=3239220 RepID=UPI00352644E7
MEALKIIEQDGRYIWVAHPATTNPGGVGFSPISFSTEDAAKADWDIYLRSPGDGKGRTLRTREQIETLLRVAAETSPECNGASLPSPQWQKEDASGCNWYVDMDTGDPVKCLKYLESAIIGLQAAYNLIDKVA